jgi:hypothetical protein
VLGVCNALRTTQLLHLLKRTETSFTRMPLGAPPLDVGRVLRDSSLRSVLTNITCTAQSQLATTHVQLVLGGAHTDYMPLFVPRVYGAIHALAHNIGNTAGMRVLRERARQLVHSA